MQIIPKICIIGLGAIGGSIAIAIKNRAVAYETTGFDISYDNMKKAVELALVNNLYPTLKGAVTNADVIIIATPPSATVKTILEILPFTKPDAIITDTASIKEKIFEELPHKLPNEVIFIGSNPLVNIERSGPQAATSDIFNNKCVIITPMSDKEDLNVIKIKHIWQKIGAIPFILSSKKHDKILASTSHLPHAVAYALLNTILNFQRHDETLKDLKTDELNNLRSIIGKNPKIWRDIILYNRKNILFFLEQFRAELDILREYIASTDAKSVEKYFSDNT